MEDHNVLTDPGEELRASLISHAFGVDSYDVREEGAGARARVVLLHSEGFVDVLLDSRGYTIESTSPSRHLSQSTFESLDALLIALSPAYASAMHDELMKRFEGGTGLERFERKWDEEEPAWID